jgi:hypothetical protein
LDHDVAESYLSDLIGWVPDEGSSTDRSGENERKGWNLGSRGTNYGRSSDSESGSEEFEKRRYTPASIFDGLHRQLDAEIDGERMLLKLQSLNDEGWVDLHNGDIVELTGTLKIPEVAKVIGAISGSGIMDFLRVLQESGEVPADPESQMGLLVLQTMSEIGSADSSPNAAVVVVELAASPEYRFVATLKRDYLRVGVGDLTGEVKVLGKVVRKINEGDPPIGLEGLVPGLEAFKGLKELGSGSDDEPEDDDNAIGYPAATLVPVGIWQ